MPQDAARATSAKDAQATHAWMSRALPDGPRPKASTTQGKRLGTTG